MGDTPTGDRVDSLLRDRGRRQAEAADVARFPLTFEHESERWQIVYRFVPPATMARLLEADHDDDAQFAIPVLLASLVSWDRTRRGGQPVPLDFKQLRRLPKVTIAALMGAIQDDQRRLGYLKDEGVQA